MRNSKAMGLFAALLAVVMLSSCGAGSSQVSGQQTGGVFTIGTDSAPPLPSVVSVQVQLTSVMLTDGTTTANLLDHYAGGSGLRQAERPASTCGLE